MPKRSSKKRKQEKEDPNEVAFRIIREATEEDEAPEEPETDAPDADEAPPEKNPAAVALGRLGGKKGGPARAKKLSAKRRSEIAKKAADARWANRANGSQG